MPKLTDMTSILVIGAAMTAMSCSEKADWRDGLESTEQCVARISEKRMLNGKLSHEDRLWIPQFTYDVTKVSSDDLKTLIKTGSDNSPATKGTIALDGAGEAARARFLDEPASVSGSLFLAEDPAMFKVRGTPGRYRDIIEQGCDRQLSGMRLISWGATREEAMIDGEFPDSKIPKAEIRRIMEQNN